jgi:16S rRNA G966 N2-methylase RsmD
MDKEKNFYYDISSQSAFPFLESNEKVLEKIFKVLEKKFHLKAHSDQQLIDLGSGNGSVILYCSLNYDIKSFGIEINSNLVIETEKRIERLKHQNKALTKRLEKITLIRGDLFNISLDRFDFIYIFSLPTMQKYLNHIFCTAKKNSILISYKYPLENFPYLKEVHILKIKINKKKILTYFYWKF